MNENSDAREGASRRGENSAEQHPLNHHQKATQSSTNGFQINGHRSQPKVDFWVVIDALTHRWHWLAIGALVFGACFFELGSWYIKPKFTASAQLLRDDTSSEFFKQTPMTPETFAGLLRSPELLRRVGAQADPPIPAEKLTKLIKIEPEPDSDLVKVHLASSDPHEAVELLNYFLQQAVDFTKEFQKNQAAKLSNEYLKKQVAQMDSDIKVLQEQFRGITTSFQANQPAQVGSNSTPAVQSPPVISPSQLIAIQKQRERLDALFTQLNDLLAKYHRETSLGSSHSRANRGSPKATRQPSTWHYQFPDSGGPGCQLAFPPRRCRKPRKSDLSDKAPVSRRSSRSIEVPST